MLSQAQQDARLNVWISDNFSVILNLIQDRIVFFLR